MSETYQVSPGVRMSISSDEVGLPPNSAELQTVWLWDLGPEKPKPPHKPTLPQKGKDGEPEYELAKVEFTQLLEEYAADLKTYKQRKQEYADFIKGNGGPVERRFWSCDAEEALERDQRAVTEGRQEMRRYHISARTRGHKGLPNRGLPEGLKPGHGQAEQERRRREGDELLDQARRADPVFGKQELRS